jgi:hypothetical protein
MSDLERARRGDNSDEIGDSREDNSDEISAAQGEPRTGSDSQRDASSRNQRSTADDLDDALRERSGDGYGEVY